MMWLFEMQMLLFDTLLILLVLVKNKANLG